LPLSATWSIFQECLCVPRPRVGRAVSNVCRNALTRQASQRLFSRSVHISPPGSGMHPCRARQRPCIAEVSFRAITWFLGGESRKWMNRAICITSPPRN
jgi:hypothetical protein